MVRCTPRRAQNGYAAADVAVCSVPAVGPSGAREFFRRSATEPAAASDRAVSVAHLRCGARARPMNGIRYAVEGTVKRQAQRRLLSGFLLAFGCVLVTLGFRGWRLGEFPAQ